MKELHWMDNGHESESWNEWLVRSGQEPFCGNCRHRDKGRTDSCCDPKVKNQICSYWEAKKTGWRR